MRMSVGASSGDFVGELDEMSAFGGMPTQGETQVKRGRPKKVVADAGDGEGAPL